MGTHSPLPWKVLEGWVVMIAGFNLWGSWDGRGDKAVNFAWKAIKIMNPAGAVWPCCADVSFAM